MANCSPSSQPEFWFTPLNIAKIMCCLADAHIALKGCYVDDRFRLNANPKLEAPFLFVQYPIDFQWAGPGAFSDVDGRSDGHLWNANVDWFIFQKYDEAGNSRNRHAELTSQCWQIGLQILEKLRAVRRDSPYGWDVLTVNAMMMGEFSNTERWAKNLCGYGFQMVIQGVAAVDRCDQFFDEDKLACICAPGTLPEPTPLCCAFSIVITTLGAIGRPGEPGYLTSFVTFADPACAVDPATLYYRWTEVTAGGEVFVTEGVGLVGDIDWNGGATYTVEAWFVDNEDCRAEDTKTPPIDNPCCDALQVTLVQGGDFLELAIEFVPFLPECRFQISSIIIRRDGIVVSSGETTIAAPAPGTYVGEVTLSSGCIKLSNEVVVP